VAAANSTIFISYRRQEASYLAAWLHEFLRERFGAQRVFLDIDSIRPGVNFIAAINQAIASSALMLVLIGPHWLTLGEEGRRRLDDPTDPVRLELEAALAQHIAIVPVLLEDTAMPPAEELPGSVAEVAALNAFRVHYENFRSDIHQLLNRAEGLLGDSAPARSDTAILPDPPYPSNSRASKSGTLGAMSGTERDRKQRARLLRAVSVAYSEHLRQSLKHENTIELALPLARLPAKIVRAADQVLPLMPEGEERLPLGTSLLDVFDQASGLDGDGVLVLGGPGAGKTTLLVGFARQLTDLAKDDPEHPVPVYLPLSSWAVSQRPFADWLVEQLNQLYKVAPPLAYRWIEDGQLFFILDGLSDIPSHRARLACVQEINRFNRFGRQFPVPMVVATRQAEYEMLGTKLQLDAAVAIGPLSADVVLSHLQEAGSRMQTIVAAVRSDPGMVDLLRSPLLLSMLTLTYAGLPESRLNALSSDPAERRRELTRNYIDRRFELERQASSRANTYPPDRTMHWLESLAHHLRRNQQTILLPDRLVPTWLPSQRMRRLLLLTPSLVWGLAFGLSFAVSAEVAVRLEVGLPLQPALFLVLMTALGLVVGLANELPAPYRFLSWIPFGVAFATLSRPAANPDPYYVTLLEGLYFTLFFGLIGEAALRMIGRQLPLTEHLSWSWKEARPSIGRFLIGGLVFAVAFDVPNWLSHRSRSGLELSTLEAILFGSIFGIVLGLFFSLSLGFVSGLRITLIPTRLNPYEGVIRSLRYGLAVGLGAALIAGSFFFFTALIVSPRLAIVRALAWGPGVGVLWGLAAGFGGVLQYVTLRLLLWRYDVAPLRYVRWLNYVVGLRLVYRGAGGGYVFIHPIIQDHLAGSARATAGSRE
jgi:eukaryotic-like serine/threonine-protein kinase